MSTPKVTLYFDLLSPFSYVAFHILKNSPIFSKCNITYTPILLRDLFTKCQNTPPIAVKSIYTPLSTHFHYQESPNPELESRTYSPTSTEITPPKNQANKMIPDKSTWINKERLYWSKRLKLPMCETPPPGFPFPTVEVQSILLVLGERYPEKLASVVERLYLGLWGEGDSRIVTTDGFMGVLEEAFGGKVAREILQASNEPETKLRLTENTTRAFDTGAFGLPWFECVNSRGETECFWGVDHLAEWRSFWIWRGGMLVGGFD
ncbi:hypothetical protein ABOM_007298 [Aspergillus bombycis]|uniref:DSBA-like thioredoxin domain-containing protein n=1 Tax=Aspergillus bombycis TaxID=109264 RepID=A0A1F7ZX65_9EURO|nr:hypothetical protein ABOM_007298 [Aspergillus bombycis]OGM44071.1 hypothetical protein ABOM_007298 [Aspergillus bombycis]